MPAPSQLGKVASWNDDRGYGFVVPLDAGDGPERLFFHVRDYTQAGRRPEIGELVRYTPARQADGRWRAGNVVRTVPAATRRSGRRHPASTAKRAAFWPMTVLIASWAAAWWWAVHTDRAAIAVLPGLLTLNLVTFGLYAFDKRAAQSGQRRVPETQLHLCELLGGWPAAWWAQRRFRHKTNKRSYRIGYWAMTTLHLLALVLWLAA
ncbi:MULTISPECIES: DUF1294 domain-containing protein [Luteimonas]|uniref:DUF1294 domain-containing protein n=1 Tax=Luteimonas TaxID=83614 RepID=UPI000C7E6A7C|nr:MULTISPECIES: DUF1294 domain-containing protein [Luteimonas]